MLKWGFDAKHEAARYDYFSAVRDDRSPGSDLVDTTAIHLTITAHSGDGLILGNVVTALANLFNPPLPASRRRRSVLTQLPKVPSLTPKSQATRAIGLPVSRTIRTAPSRKS